jgi:hypothetical protein
MAPRPRKAISFAPHGCGRHREPREVRAGDVLRAMDMIVKIKGYYAPEKREIIQRLSELSG